MSGLIPLLRCVRYASRFARVKFPMEINTNLLRCSMVFAAACVILELKSIKYCKSSMEVDTFEELFPLLSLRKVFSWLCMSCCTLKRHLLKLAAWLQITVASMADFSHLCRDSCEMRLDAGGGRSQAGLPSNPTVTTV